ncbi:Endonuclease/exonuclease/phosphatase [Phlyctochytrium arcticum]|nr:Endonuclease/exonuclease/phosphatase [Phlyctochytrium arcticum]
MGELQAIAPLLRPTEVCQITADLHYVKKNGERRRRSLALIMNTQGGEEACVFVLRRGGTNVSEIAEILPIFADFRIAVSQNKESSDTAAASTTSRSELTVRLESGSREAKLVTSDLEKLRPFLVHIKNLMTVAREREYTMGSGTHHWIQYYEQGQKSAKDALKDAANLEGAIDDKTQAVLPNPFINSDSNVGGTAVKSVKDAWVARELRNRESKFVDFDSKQVFIGSWNVNGQSPTQSLSPWLRPTDDPPASVYVLGFQELDLTSQAYLYSDTTKEDEWCKAIEQALRGTGKAFFKVASKQLVGMLILVYVREDEREKVSEVSAEYLGTGILGMMGNKGAASVRFRFYDSYLCFVNCHLAADASMVERRNQDYQEISRRIAFPLPTTYSDFTAYTHRNPWVSSYYEAAQNGAPVPAGGPGGATNRNVTSIYEADHLFFLGDLNYRIQLPESDVKSHVARGDVGPLLKFDQLLIEQEAKRAFQGYQEAPITFQPTFKYDIGTDRFDTSEKRRTPSFCDRILWFKNPLHSSSDADWTTVQWYKSAMELTMSDHKPVMALSSLKIRNIGNRFDGTHEEILRELDKFENESLPDLVVDNNILDFGDIRYGVPMTKTIVVENRGQVIAQYKFVPKPEEIQACKRWCYVNPPASTLLPGDQLKVNVTILVDETTAPALNFQQDSLDDILILHTENGKDHFLSVMGVWLPSTFGNSLGALCTLSKPIRQWTPEERSSIDKPPAKASDNPQKDASSTAVTDKPPSDGSGNTLEPEGLSSEPPTPDGKNRVPIPIQLWRLTDFIFRFGMDVDNLFTATGDMSVQEYLSECLDTGAPFDLGVLLADPGHPHQGTQEGHDPNSRRASSSSTADDLDSDAGSGSRTPIEQRKSISLDIDELIKTVPPMLSPTPVDSVKNESPTTVATPPVPKPRGRAVSVHSAAGVLMTFLRSLAVPTVPEPIATRCATEGYASYAAAVQCVKGLPEVHFKTFQYVVRFLRAIVENYRGQAEFSVQRVGKCPLNYHLKYSHRLPLTQFAF